MGQSATAQSRYAAGLPGRDLETGPQRFELLTPRFQPSADWHIAGRVPYWWAGLLLFAEHCYASGDDLRDLFRGRPPSPCRPLAAGGVVSVTAHAVVGVGGQHAETYRQSIDRALESGRPGRWRRPCAAGDGQGGGGEGRIEPCRPQAHAEIPAKPGM